MPRSLNKIKLIGHLKIQPDLRAGAEKLAKPKSRIRRKVFFPARIWLILLAGTLMDLANSAALRFRASISSFNNSPGWMGMLGIFSPRVRTAF